MSQTQSASLFEVARTLGATRFMLARHVALPLARPALAVGLSLALLETLNDIGACEYLGVRTLTLSIFTTWLNRSSLPGAAQIACVMLVVIAALIALERYGRRDKRFHLAMRRAQPPAPIVLSGWAGIAASAVCALPVVLGFLIPAIDLAWEAANRRFDPDLARAALNTILFAAGATIAALILGFGAVMAARMLRRDWTSWALTFAGLGYAVPGTVLALALLSPLVAIDEGLNAGLRPLARGRAAPRRRAAHLAPRGRCAAHARPEAGRDHAAHPCAAVASRARRRRATGVRGLPQGVAGDLAAAPAQRRNIVHLHLPVRHARQFRGRRARRAADRGGRNRAGDPHGALLGSRADAGGGAAIICYSGAMRVALALLLLINAPALAQESYPSRLVEMVVPFAPGGGTDIIARVVAER